MVIPGVVHAGLIELLRMLGQLYVDENGCVKTRPNYFPFGVRSKINRGRKRRNWYLIQDN
ncbi:MAG: hypothetical protein JWP75_1716 [Frondihabitans sp.]|nr:hypothetical protein [Frondihabitans sp.]